MSLPSIHKHNYIFIRKSVGVRHLGSLSQAFYAHISFIVIAVCARESDEWGYSRSQSATAAAWIVREKKTDARRDERPRDRDRANAFAEAEHAPLESTMQCIYCVRCIKNKFDFAPHARYDGYVRSVGARRRQGKWNAERRGRRHVDFKLFIDHLILESWRTHRSVHFVDSFGKSRN